MLEIITMVLGPVATNAYLVGDADTPEAVVSTLHGTGSLSWTKRKGMAGRSDRFG
jgi:hypothetical protein